VLAGIESGQHAYFVHSYHMAVASPDQLIAHVDYGHPVTAIVGRDNMIGTQFHPEKSQATGLKMIANFLGWAP
jgi:glutamine amidotransferase